MEAFKKAFLLRHHHHSAATNEQPTPVVAAMPPQQKQQLTAKSSENPATAANWSSDNTTPMDSYCLRRQGGSSSSRGSWTSTGSSGSRGTHRRMSNVRFSITNCRLATGEIALANRGAASSSVNSSTSREQMARQEGRKHQQPQKQHQQQQKQKQQGTRRQQWEQQRYKTIWRSPEKAGAFKKDPLQEVFSFTRRRSCLQKGMGSSIYPAATSIQEHESTGAVFSVSEKEVFLEVPRGGRAWAQTELKNEGRAVLFFALQQLQEEEILPLELLRSHLLQQQPSKITTGFFAWPLFGVVLPGETVTLYFGFGYNSSGLHYCDWELRIHPGSYAASYACVVPAAASAAAAATATTTTTTTITAVAAVSTVPSPVEALWQQFNTTCRGKALGAAHEILQQLLQGIELCKSNLEENARDKNDPGVKGSLFVLANLSLGLRATPPLVASCLPLRQQRATAQPQPQQHLELLHKTFGPSQEGRLCGALQQETDKELLYPGNDPQPPQRKQKQHQELRPHMQQQQNAYGAAENCLSLLLGRGVETFVSTLPEALNLAGLAAPEDEKGKQGLRSSKRQYNRSRHESKTCEEYSGSTAAAAAVSAVAANSDAIADEEGAQMGHRIAEQLLEWLLLEAIGAAEPQLLLHLAVQEAAAGGAVAEAARQQWHQEQRSGLLFQQQLQQIPLPSLLDLRVQLMAEYLCRKQVYTVKNCRMGVVLFDGKTTEVLLSFLKQQQQLERQQFWGLQLLQQRLGFLVNFLPATSRGVLLCLEVYPRHQHLLQQRLLQDMIEEYVLPALVGEEQEQLLPVVCLYTPEEVASLIDDAAARKGLYALDNNPGSTAAAARAAHIDAEEFGVSPCLFIVPSWQHFFSAATGRLLSLQQEFLYGAPHPAAEATVNERKGTDEAAALPTRSNYLEVQRQLSGVAELLDIDFVTLDYPSFSATAEAVAAAEAEAQGAERNYEVAAATAAAAAARSPWLLPLPATRALGPYVVSYLRAACLLLGIASDTLQQRAAEAVIDWREEAHRRQSIDAAATAANRRMQRKLKDLATDRRSCCRFSPQLKDAADVSVSLKPVQAEKPLTAGNKEETAVALLQHVQHMAAAVLCSYWEEVLPLSPAEAAITAATFDPVLRWASLQLQQLRTIVSGSIVSSVLLAGDLVSLICGFALEGDLVLTRNHQLCSPVFQQDFADVRDAAQKADAAAAAAAATASEAGMGGLTRGWLRLSSGTAAEDSHSSNSNASSRCSSYSSCSIQPPGYGVRVLRQFLQQQLLVILEIAEQREVFIQLPREVVFRVNLPHAAAATTGAAAATELTRGRRTSDAGGVGQRSSNKKRRGSTKPEISALSQEDTAAAGAAGTPATEVEKQQPILVVCHLPPSQLLWEVFRTISSSADAAADEENNTQKPKRKLSHGEHVDFRACGVYATLTPAAIKEAIAFFNCPPLFLWLGERLSRQTNEMEKLLESTGIPDATTVMSYSLVTPEKSAQETRCSIEKLDSQASSSDSLLLGSALSLSYCSSNSGTTNNSTYDNIYTGSTSIESRKFQGSVGTEHLLLVGPIAKNSWQFAEGGKVLVDAFLDKEPLLQMLQGKALNDILMADDALLDIRQCERVENEKEKI